MVWLQSLKIIHNEVVKGLESLYNTRMIFAGKSILSAVYGWRYISRH
jgi:hypothetical protein